MIKLVNAIFNKNPKTGECYAIFPKVPWLTVTGIDYEDLTINCQIALARVLVCAEKSNVDIDIESKESVPKKSLGGISTLIKVDTVGYKKLYDLETVRRNVSIPAWLNKLAVEKNVNFSKVLQDALMKECEVSEEMKNEFLNERRKVHSLIGKIKSGGTV